MKKEQKKVLVISISIIMVILILSIVGGLVYIKKSSSTSQSVVISNLKCCYFSNGIYGFLTLTCNSPYLSKPAVEFTDHVCVNSTTSAYACQSHGYKCDAMYDGSYGSGNNQYYLFCDISSSASFVGCPNGCDFPTGLCNGGQRDCTEDTQQCCDSASGCLSDPNKVGKDVYKCVGGHWTIGKTCNSNEKCTEDGSTAKCDFKNPYYCLDNQQGCYLSETNINNQCYTTRSDCLNHIGYCCYSTDVSGSALSFLSGYTCYQQINGFYNFPQCKNTLFCCFKDHDFIWRLGSCNSGESSLTVQNINQQTCNDRNQNVTPEEKKCQSCTDWALKIFKAPADQCVSKSVIDLVWYNPLSWIVLTGITSQDYICPIFLIVLAGIIIVIGLIITLIIFVFTRKGGKKK